MKSRTTAFPARPSPLAAIRHQQAGLPVPVIMLLTAILLGFLTPRAGATWSIIIVDSRTKEIAVGSATCLTSFDLERWLPVVVVDTGAGCAQSSVDSTGANRRRIWDGFIEGMDPDDILDLLESQDSGHHARQYGIVNTRDRAATFTGTSAGAYADGVVGSSSALVYAIQGNVLTGAPVVEMAEQAVLLTEGGLPEKLMAAMEAARSMGGDGRCSCAAGDPTGCGSPPGDFAKSAHVGFMIVSRSGDIDGHCNSTGGCASGDYFLNLNVPNQGAGAPDPVLQLQAMFDAWRVGLDGRPDALHSTATVDPPVIPGYEPASATMTITVRDRHDTVLDGASLDVLVEHTDDSAHVASISPPVHLGGGMFVVTLTGQPLTRRSGQSPPVAKQPTPRSEARRVKGQPGGGIDRYRVSIDDSIRPVVVIPIPTLIIAAAADLDVDGDVDREDYAVFAGCLGGPSVPADKLGCHAADLDDDVDIDLADFARLQREFAHGPCAFLRIAVQPEPLVLTCGDPLTLSAEAEGDPVPGYQWLFHGALPSFEGIPIPGAMQSTYHVESAEDDDRGFYSCLVLNTCGTVPSRAVRVRVLPDPCE